MKQMMQSKSWLSHHRAKPFQHYGLLWCLLFIGFNTVANDQWRWHGFVSQGLMQAQRSNFVNDDGKISTALTELGMNSVYQLNNSWRLSGQLMYLDGGNRYQRGWRIDYLFVNWTALNTLDWQLDLYLGRFKNMHWLYSSTRDVAMTRPLIVLPQSVYFDAFRDIAVGSDGLALKSTNNTRYGEMEINWSLGATPISRENSTQVLAKQVSGDTEQKYVHQFSVFFRPELSQQQWGISLLDSDFTYRRGLQDPFYDGDFTVQRVMLNWRYSAEFWELSSELVQERVAFKGFYAPSAQSDQFSQGVYLLGRYDLSNRNRLYLSYDYFIGNKDDPTGQLLPQRSAGMVAPFFGYQRDAAIALSHDLRANLQFKLEYHSIIGTGRLGPNVVPDVQINRYRQHDIWAMQLMYWF